MVFRVGQVVGIGADVGTETEQFVMATSTPAAINVVTPDPFHGAVFSPTTCHPLPGIIAIVKK